MLVYQRVNEGYFMIPSGKRLHNYGKSPCYSWENPLYMAIFNSFLYVYQRVFHIDGKVGEMTGFFSAIFEFSLTRMVGNGFGDSTCIPSGYPVGYS